VEAVVPVAGAEVEPLALPAALLVSDPTWVSWLWACDDEPPPMDREQPLRARVVMRAREGRETSAFVMT
jgi:hypothetical protein